MLLFKFYLPTYSCCLLAPCLLVPFCLVLQRTKNAPQDYPHWTWPRDYEFDYVDASYLPPSADIQPAFHNLRPSNHPWLQFRNIEQQERQAYLNRLAEIQDYTLESPRILDWALLETARLTAYYDSLFKMEFNGDAAISVPMWRRIFSLSKPVYRELCLEFYSTLKVNFLPIEDTISDRVIHFRLGGKQRHCTVAEFGYLCGMFERREMKDGLIPQYLRDCVYDISRFADGRLFSEFWHDISGQAGFRTGLVKSLPSEPSASRFYTR